MPTEEVVITVRRPKAGELRTEYIIAFPISGSRSSATERNEALAWKIINQKLQAKGFLGFYPRDQDERELFMQLRGSPQMPKAGTLYANKTAGSLLVDEKVVVPTLEELMEMTQTELQVMAVNLGLSKGGRKEQVAKRIEAHIRRDNYDALAKQQAIELAERKVKNIKPIPAADVLATLGRKELQEFCRNHGMSEAGDKVELIMRLKGEIPPERKTPETPTAPTGDPLDALGHKGLQRLCKERKIDWVGTKDELLARLKTRAKKTKAGLLKTPPKDELMEMGRKDLQLMCLERGIDEAGNREVLIDRLLAAGPKREVVAPSGGDQVPEEEDVAGEEVRQDGGGDSDEVTLTATIVVDEMNKELGGTGFACSNCGDNVMPDTTSCLSCKAVFEPKEEETPEAIEITDDVPPEEDAPETDTDTPPDTAEGEKGAVEDEDSAGEGESEEDDEDEDEAVVMDECGACGKAVEVDATVCPHCNAAFDEETPEEEDGDDDEEGEKTPETEEPEDTQGEEGALDPAPDKSEIKAKIAKGLEDIGFKELQGMCKDHEINAGGGKKELRERLVEHLAEEAQEE